MLVEFTCFYYFFYPHHDSLTELIMNEHEPNDTTQCNLIGHLIYQSFNAPQKTPRVASLITPLLHISDEQLMTDLNELEELNINEQHKTQYAIMYHGARALISLWRAPCGNDCLITAANHLSQTSQLSPSELQTTLYLAAKSMVHSISTSAISTSEQSLVRQQEILKEYVTRVTDEIYQALIEDPQRT